MPLTKALMRATAFCSLWLLAACGSGDAPPPPSGASYHFSGLSDTQAAELRAAIDPLFQTGEYGDAGQTRALLILHRGEIVAEVYAPGYDKDSKLLGWSLSKLVTGLLVGMMVTDGRLALDEPAPVAAWASPGDPRGEITLRQLLQMRSGLDHREGVNASEGGEPYEADTPRMLFLDGVADMARYAENRPLEAAPGERFEYSSPTSVILSDIMTNALTKSSNPVIRRDAMLRFVNGRLKEPLGLNSLTVEFDAHGTMIGAAMMHATARDWAKLGEFMRHNGAVRNAQILPTSWTRFMKTPGKANAAYGAHLWLNRPPTGGATTPLFPEQGPADLFGATGHLGQFLLVSPERKLTIVRLGHSEESEMRALTDRMAALVALF